MSKELKLQTDIIKSVRRDGGYGRKLSNHLQVGIPDLLLALFPFGPCLTECKDFGAVPDKFDRQLNGSPTTPVTPKQSYEMELFSKQYEDNQTIYTPSRRAAFVLVGMVHQSQHKLVVMKRDAERITHEMCYGNGCVHRQTGLHYDIGQLMEHIGAIRVKLM